MPTTQNCHKHLPGNWNGLTQKGIITHCVEEPDNQQSNTLTEVQEKVWKLHQELQGAELQEALTKKITSICVVQPQEGTSDSLGPTILTLVMNEVQ